jgi:hypothetical protein
MPPIEQGSLRPLTICPMTYFSGRQDGGENSNRQASGMVSRCRFEACVGAIEHQGASGMYQKEIRTERLDEPVSRRRRSGRIDFITSNCSSVFIEQPLKLEYESKGAIELARKLQPDMKTHIHLKHFIQNIHV